MTDDQHQPFVRIETVTPEKAGKWLKLNTHNRDLTATRVKTLVGAIERDEFNLTGDAIVFAGNGQGDVLSGPSTSSSVSYEKIKA